MTSGNFRAFPVSSVFVDRPNRQRRELTDIDELADSIARTGLINPIVITKEGKLIAGERRLTAIQQLGWTNIPVQFVEDLSELELQLIELEENVRRVDLSWQDQCLAVERYHNLKLAETESWTLANTASALGFNVPSISNKIAVAKELIAGNEKVTAAPQYSAAKNIVKRTTERKKAAELETITASPEQPAKQAPLLNEDFHEWAAAYTSIKFNFIHCDFPYGINADKADQGAAAAFGGYADGKEVYFNLLSSLAMAMSNVVAESAHLVFWFSMDYYQETFDKLTEMGWNVNPFPLIWFKSDNTGIIPDANRGPRRVYETAFLASRGDRKIVQAVSNVAAAAVVKRIHMSEKSEVMLTHFFRMLIDDTTIFLDPTCGSANAVRVALRLGARFALGIEKNPEFFTLARTTFFDGDNDD